jgi:hypothetical protein
MKGVFRIERLVYISQHENKGVVQEDIINKINPKSTFRRNQSSCNLAFIKRLVRNTDIDLLQYLITNLKRYSSQFRNDA